MRQGHFDPIDIEVRGGRAHLLTHESEVFGNLQQFPTLDVADTLQLTAIMDSFLQYYLGESRAQLVTADGGLKEAAEELGIPVILLGRDVAP